MAKRTAETTQMQKNFETKLLATLERHQDYQNRRIDELIWQVVGNEKLGIEGLKPAVKELQGEVHDFKKWRNEMWKLDLKKWLTWDVIKKIIVICMTIGGGFSVGKFGIGKLLEVIFK
jgi:hypothetical protein